VLAPFPPDDPLADLRALGRVQEATASFADFVVPASAAGSLSEVLREMRDQDGR
jgi:hypothetical protein